jgi:DNA-binding Lrp family transcriptional regulator
MKKNFMTRKEIADELRISTRTVDRIEKRGIIRRIRLRGHPRYRRVDVLKQLGIEEDYSI